MGDALGALGDPRFDAAHWQLPDDETLGFREVGAGRFLMGTDPEKDADGWDDEQPQHPLDLETFYIARFPVTAAQFAAFASDSGHEPADRDALRGNPSHPVTLATWYDARKYCDWLQARLQGLAKGRVAEVPDGPAKRFWQGVAKGRVKAGLPSEAEWEKAARGADGRIYPWGRDIDPTLANYKETDLKAPCAVGCFPAGKSPCGCEDMSGNVWEWTRNLWGSDYMKAGFRYRYRVDDGREDLNAAGDVFRVLRGGSFAGNSRDLRCAVRLRLSPLNRNDYLGFRVVWSPLL